MTDPNEPQQHDPAAADPQAPPPPAEPIAPTEPIVPQADAQAAVPAPGAPVPAAAASQSIEVKRKWLLVGSGVGAFACLGLAFGLGYITGDQTGGHDQDHGSRYERGEDMRGFTGGDGMQNQFGRDQRWRMMPPGSQNGDEQAPGQPGQSGQQNQTPGTTTATPGTAS
ncbi:hypothetical protein [Gordonia neofelifaecis]|uniref:Uncharacterized protein n=1 Tax=Gordonia neofelifaecis NRRL B-59395 TaxID=644548 RepID=F1YJR8_9ACTN|nr:hypothetical protein [Gordonia neofelifaecis]EGD55000.1 hypothetical protein SCNU_10741 [Gordonia neofelifaecis NRRL B-59395]